MLYALQSEVMGSGLLAEPEMQNFADAYLALPSDAKEKAHAALYRFTDPALDRYVALAGSDPAAAEEFRSTLRSYTRAYAFLAAIMAWHDPDLERLYLYGKYLLVRLPPRSDPSVYVGAVDLTHLRVARTGETDASLGAGIGDQVLPGFTGAGIGALGEKELQALSEIIEALNDKFGHELTEGDQLVIEQHVVTATGDEELRAAATANTLENYGYVFDRRFEELMLDRHEANAELIRRFLDEPEVNEVFTSWARQESYRRIREAGEEAS
jgi:type I restriction enzyme R subunit